MRNHVIDRITDMARSNDRIMVLTADLGYNVLERFEEKYPNRYINVGIAEQNMTAIAAGLAMEGNQVITYSIGNFPTLRCIEHIRNDICYHNADVKILAVGGGFSYGELGMTHHATEDIAMMRVLPNMRVYAPADPIEAIMAIDDAMSNHQPCYIRLARGHDMVVHRDKLDGSITKLIPFRKYYDGQADVAIISTGTILSEGVKAEICLNNKNIRTKLYSCPTIKPLDEKNIERIAVDSSIIVTMEEHSVVGGLGGAVSEVLSGMSNHGCLLRFGLQDTFSGEVGDTEYLRRYYGIDSETVVRAIMETIRE